MADETKVLINVDVLNNFVEAKKEADAAKKALDEFIKSGEKNAKKQTELATEYAKTKKPRQTAVAFILNNW